MNKKRRLIVTGLIAIAVVIAAAIVFMFKCGLFIPLGTDFCEREITGSGGIKYELKDKKLTIRFSKGSLIWESTDDRKIQDIIVSDIDRDNEDELILLLWKKGRYGSHMPFWVKDDEAGYSQHIFIYDVIFERDGVRIKSKWGSSYLPMEVKRFRLAEVSSGIILIEDKNKHTSAWKWDSFGLKEIDSSVSFICFGDNLIHKDIYEKGLREHGGDFSYLYEPYTDLIGKSDLSVVNAETPLVSDPKMYGGYPSFGTPVAVGDALADAGFSVITCANNHVMDRGFNGVDTSYETYADNGAKVLGISHEGENVKPYEIISKNGISFALFDYTYGINSSSGRSDKGTDLGERINILKDYDKHLSKDTALYDDDKNISGLIKEAKDKADIVIVFVHWGTEYQKEPDSAQRFYANLFADAGADVVVGAHPHVTQPCEMVDDTIVYYSLGNFVSSKGKPGTDTGAYASFTASYTYDGIAVTDHSMTEFTILSY